MLDPSPIMLELFPIPKLETTSRRHDHTASHKQKHFTPSHTHTLKTHKVTVQPFCIHQRSTLDDILYSKPSQGAIYIHATALQMMEPKK